jgi:hypothetical protein
MWEAQHLPDWTRIAIRLTHYQPELGFIYHHNAKAASTTTHHLLGRVLGRYKQSLPSPLREQFQGMLGGPSYWKAILPVLDDPTVFRFSFVRHPVSRAVSTFNNFFVEAQNEYTKRHRFTRRRSGLKMHDPSIENFERFLDFSEEVIAEDPDLCDLHIRTQRRNLLVDHLRFDHIGRMESFQHDVTEILAKLGLGPFLIDDDFAIRENNSVSKERLRTPSDTQKQRIARIYAEDFAAFGYSLD